MYTREPQAYAGLTMRAANEPAASSRFACYMTIAGKVQGKFKADSASKAVAGKIPCFVYDYSLISRNAATGIATGKRQHSPVTIVKAIDAATPQIFQAAAKNEPLESVIIEIHGTLPAGGFMGPLFIVTLTNAAIAGVRHLYPGRPGLGMDQWPMEEVRFVFGAIQIEHRPGKTIADDAWSAAGT